MSSNLDDDVADANGGFAFGTPLQRLGEEVADDVGGACADYAVKSPRFGSDGDDLVLLESWGGKGLGGTNPQESPDHSST